ncbi:MAG: hypothetical protein ACTSYF_08735 [Promethearchaeota archaeon]
MIQDQWDFALSYFYDMMEQNMNENIIETIGKTINIFCKNVKPIMNELKKYKENVQWVERNLIA